MTDSIQKRGKALEEDYFEKQNKEALIKFLKNKADAAKPVAENAANPNEKPKKVGND